MEQTKSFADALNAVGKAGHEAGIAFKNFLKTSKFLKKNRLPRKRKKHLKRVFEKHFRCKIQITFN